MQEYPTLLTLQQAATRSGKSEKTLRRWISSGKLAAQKVGEKSTDPYLIYPQDLDVATGADTTCDKTKAWQAEQQIADLRMHVVMLEAMLENMQDQLRDQAQIIEELRHERPALSSKKQTTAVKRKTSTSRTIC
jgi:excisionase family DNA binding protein